MSTRIAPRPRFNEAGAIMPRSGVAAARHVDPQKPASMRPGQSCPGVAVPGPRNGLGRKMSFNEAGAIMPRSGRLTLKY